jgi:hypothetical protein
VTAAIVPVLRGGWVIVAAVYPLAGHTTTIDHHEKSADHHERTKVGLPPGRDETTTNHHDGAPPDRISPV